MRYRGIGDLKYTIESQTVMMGAKFLYTNYPAMANADEKLAAVEKV